ncbi:unnamed protein product, partial [Rotaria sp. Silwood1]
MDLIEVDDVFSILQIESDQTASIKEVLGIPGKDNLGNYSFFIMPGIRLKLEKFIRSLRALLTTTDSTSSLAVTPLTISSGLLQRFPFLIDLIYCLESHLLTDFSLDFISNLLSNITCTKNAFRYQQSVKDFAASLYILGGRNVYEFVRLNIPGSIPCLNSLRSILTSSKTNFIEGEFQYERLKDFINMLDSQSTSTIAITITEKVLEEKVFSAYIKASQILSGCEFSILNPDDNMISFEEVNRLAYKRLSRSKCTTSTRKPVQSNDDEDENEDDDEEEYEDEDNKQYQSKKQSSENDIVDEYDESIPIDDFDVDILPNVSSSTIRGMRVFDSINNCQSDSFLPVE